MQSGKAQEQEVGGHAADNQKQIRPPACEQTIPDQFK